MKKIYIILMVAAAFLFTSIQNYSYSFDRNPMESGVDKEESDGENEDDGDGETSDIHDIREGYTPKAVKVKDTVTESSTFSGGFPDLVNGSITTSVTYKYIACCMKEKDHKCPFADEEFRCKTLKNRVQLQQE